MNRLVFFRSPAVRGDCQREVAMDRYLAGCLGMIWIVFGIILWVPRDKNLDFRWRGQPRRVNLRDLVAASGVALLVVASVAAIIVFRKP